MLEVHDLSVSYGAVRALKGVSLHIKPGEIVSLIGANGAGKSTLLKTISGLVPVRSGNVTFAGKLITSLSPDEVVALGIAHIPEGRQLFPRMSVLENLELGAYIRQDAAKVKEDLSAVLRLFPILEERKNYPAGSLSGGQQQMLAIGRGLMTRPKLLMLDEPSFGLAPLIVREISKIIKALNRQGITVLLVEQNAKLALKLCHRAYVLETGQITLQGNQRELVGDDHVRMAYLGL